MSVATASWEELTAAAAFTLGAVLATVACLRVVRAVVSVFDDSPNMRRKIRRDASDLLDRKDPPPDD